MEQTEQKNVNRNIMKLIVALLAVVVGVFLRAWALMKLYGWFVLPTFTNAPKLSYPIVLGLSMLLQYAVVPPKPSELKKEFKETDDENAALKSLAYSILIPLLVVLLGWIYTLFL